MLVGRADELGRIDALLASARAGQAGALVLRGEPGIGKTALLAWANEQATGFQILRATGVQSEAELASAGLHQLLRPLLPHLDSLPDAQRLALRAALALDAGAGTDPLAVYAGTLGLIAAGAEDGPLLCLIDDAHWLDAVSAGALAFAARRLLAEPVAMLFAARPEEGAFAAAALPQHEVSRLDDAASATLLAQVAEPLGPVAAEAVLRLAAGNPLAILELPGGLSPQQLAGSEPLAEPLPVPATVEAAFLARVQDLSPGGRRALVLAAAAGASGLGTLSDDPGVASGLAEAEGAGLVRTGPGSLEFRHPLVRAAAYQSATGTERRTAHAALAAALDPAVAPDESAWHLGSAAGAVDEEVAALLEATADRAGQRGSPWARARALERAAELTADRSLRARRLLDAGEAAFRAGQRDHGRALIEQARELATDPVLVATIAFARWDVEAEPWAHLYPSFVRDAEAVAPLDAVLAAGMLSYAFDYAIQARPLPEARALAERTWVLLGRRVVPGSFGAMTAVALWRLIELRPDEAAGLALEVLAHPVVTDDEFGAAPYLCMFLIWAGDLGARDVLDRLVATGRRRGALPGLCSALYIRAEHHLRSGLLQRAHEDALEAHTIAELVGGWRLRDARLWLAAVESYLGHAESCRAHANSAIELAGDDRPLSRARAQRSLGVLALGLGDIDAAVRELRRATSAYEAFENPCFADCHADEVEALTRAGRVDDALAALVQLEDRVARSGDRRTAGAALCCRLLLADDAAVDEAFQAALAALDGNPFSEARARLVYGERLRRAGRRVDARVQLERALATFEEAGAAPWAEHARRELRASGATLRRRDPTVSEVLTPQELQIAIAVAQGRTNRDVGAALFISPKTVELHLSRVYRKLGVGSRAEVIRLEAATPGALAAAARS